MPVTPPYPTTIRVYRAISPKSLAALREPLARQVFRVSKYDEEHGRRSFVVNADGSWVYDNTLRRWELGQGKMLLREEQDAREEAQKHIEYLQEIISKFPRLHAAFAEAPLLPQGLRFDRAERLIVLRNDTTEAASNPLWHWRVHYLLKFRPSGTEDYVPVEGGRCHIDLAPHGMILGAASGILPFQPGPSISKRFTVLHEVPVVEDAATLAAPILAKGQNVNKAPDSLQLDTNGNEVKDLRQVDGVYAYNAESGCYAYNYLGLEGKVPGCGEAVVASNVEEVNEFDPQIAFEPGDDFFMEGTGEYLGRSEFGTGFESKGLIRILKEQPESYFKKGKKYVRPQPREFGSPLADYVLYEDQANNQGTSTYMAQQIFTYYSKQLMDERAGIGEYPKPPYGFLSKVSNMPGTDKNGDKGILYFASNDQAIHLVIMDDGKIHPDLTYHGALRNGILHEYLHLIDFKTNNSESNTDERHMKIYVEQIKDDTYLETTSKYKWGMVGRCKYYLELSNKNNNRQGNMTVLSDWINELNSLSGRTGYFFTVEVWGGYELIVHLNRIK